MNTRSYCICTADKCSLKRICKRHIQNNNGDFFGVPADLTTWCRPDLEKAGFMEIIYEKPIKGHREPKKVSFQSL